MVAAAVSLGWPILVGLSDRFDPRATGIIFACAVAVMAVPHTPQSSPRRRADSVPRAAAFLDGILRNRRDAEVEPAISRRARRRMILGVIVGVVVLTPVATLILLHFFG